MIGLSRNSGWLKRCQAYVLSMVVLMAVSALAGGAQPKFQVDDFEIDGAVPVSEAATEKLLQPYLGPHTGLEKLQQAAQALELMLRAKGYTFYRVVVPPQTLANNTVRLQVRSFPLGTITMQGNSRFNEKNILRSLPELTLDKSPNLHKLSRSLLLANQHPSKNTDLRFAIDADSGKLEAKIKVTEKKPWQVFSWTDNTGTESTGDLRLGFGLQHNNLLNRDHQATLTFATNPEDDDQVRQYGINYRIPVYRSGGTIDIIGGDSNVDTGTVAEAFDINGEGNIAGIRYIQPLPRTGPLRHEIELGVFDKLFVNDISFEGQPIGSEVRSRPMNLNYKVQFQTKRLSGDFYLGYRRNLSGGSSNDDATYQLARVGSSSSWDAWGFGGSMGLRFGKWALIGRFNGQRASEPLIPGEQITAGGVYSVRGLEESEIASDYGNRYGLELWAPVIKGGFQVLGFLEGADLKRRQPLPDEIERADVASAGLGLRWNFRESIRVRFDWGYILDGLEDDRLESGTHKGDSKLHFSLFVRF